MAPRRRPARATPSQGGALGIAVALPDDLLARCLAPLSQEDRFKHVALVSKRFRAACLAPQLLHSISVRIAGGQALLPRLRSLLTFMMARASLVRQLTLWITRPACLFYSAAQHEADALVACCLSVCGAAGCLEQLTVNRETILPSIVEWLPGLTALQRLQLGSSVIPLRLPPGFSQLQALSDASLAGRPVQLERPLPSGLTRLSLEDVAGKQLPPQVVQLSKLVCLEVVGGDYEAASLAPLSSLASLRRLSLCAAGLPHSLSTLTQLDTLVCTYPDAEGDAATLAASLPRLSRLTCLAVESEHLESLPPSITRLTQLQRLYFHSDSVEDFPLPPGAWLASLRWLGLPWKALQASVGALRGAEQLEYVSTLDVPTVDYGDDEGGRQRWHSCWDFVATHPPLRCFGIDVSPDKARLPAWALLDALVHLKHRRPALLVRRTNQPGGVTFSEEVQQCTDVPVWPG